MISMDIVDRPLAVSRPPRALKGISREGKTQLEHTTLGGPMDRPPLWHLMTSPLEHRYASALEPLAWKACAIDAVGNSLRKDTFEALEALTGRTFVIDAVCNSLRKDSTL